MQEFPKEVIPLLCEYVLSSYKRACFQETFYELFRLGLIDVRNLGLTCKRLWRLCAPQLPALCEKYLVYPDDLATNQHMIIPVYPLHQEAVVTYYKAFPEWRCVIYLRYEQLYWNESEVLKVFGEPLAKERRIVVSASLFRPEVSFFVRCLITHPERVNRVLQHMREANERNKKKRRRIK